jgi:hypothetical protein
MAFLVEPGEINPSIRKEREKLFRHPVHSRRGCLVRSFNQSIPVRLFLQLGAVAINFFPSATLSMVGVRIGKSGKFTPTNSEDTNRTNPGTGTGTGRGTAMEGRTSVPVPLPVTVPGGILLLVSGSPCLGLSPVKTVSASENY